MIRTPWRIWWGWPERVIQAELASLAGRPVSYGTPPATPTSASGWTVERFQALLGYEPVGPPLANGLFARASAGVAAYRFADPRLTRGHFDPSAPLLGRDMLIEIRPLFVRLLVGLRVGDVLNRPGGPDEPVSRFGVRMDTLDGHILDGSEWVRIVKDHRSGAVRFHIDVQWRAGHLPTWWMALGFQLFGRQIQVRWRRLAVLRLRRLGQAGELRQSAPTEAAARPRA
ncbi:MAG: DUF1990 family protein [Chloroflexota bacterium]